MTNHLDRVRKDENAATINERQSEGAAVRGSGAQQPLPPTSEEPGWVVVLKVAAFVAIPIALLYIVKMMM